MTTIFEIVAELHERLRHIGLEEFGGARQQISDNKKGIGAYNQPANQLAFMSWIPPVRIAADDPRHDEYPQGLHCVEICLYVVWGGRHHDETPISEPEIMFSIHDRTEGGRTARSWSSSGQFGDLARFDDIELIVRHTLGQKILMEPHTRIIATEREWREEFEGLRQNDAFAMWDSARFGNLKGKELEAALEGYDPVNGSTLIVAEPDGQGGWRECDTA